MFFFYYYSCFLFIVVLREQEVSCQILVLLAGEVRLHHQMLRKAERLQPFDRVLVLGRNLDLRHSQRPRCTTYETSISDINLV